MAQARAHHGILLSPCLGALLAAALWTACGGDRDTPPAPSGEPAPAEPAWLVEADAGIDFMQTSGGRGEFLFPEIMGFGAALVDVDDDGDLDAYLINGATGFEGRSEGGPLNRFYRQEEGGRFVDATAGSGLGDPGYGMGVAAGDVDNDGHVDLYVTNVGADRLYRNLGDGTFRDVTAEAGVDVPGWSSSATFWDYDRDGFLDLFVCRYVEWDPAIDCFDLAGRPDYCDPTSFPGAPDVLLRNLGDGTFRDVTAAVGMRLVGRGLGVVAGDFNGDLRPDLYVANDREANHLWVQQPDGTFVDEALVLGVSVNAAGAPEAGMGVVAADFDGDGGIDLFVTHMAGESNTFYRNLGADGGFEDASVASGLAQPSMPFTGFGTAAADLDNDGDLDVLVANGRVIRGEVLAGVRGLPSPWDQYAEPNQLYRNDGAGHFEDVPEAAGTWGREIEITRGLATGDVDGDGGIDVLINNTEGPARLYLNAVPGRGHWLRVDVFDPRLGRRALGAAVRLEAGGRAQVRPLSAGTSYLSSSDPRAHFGLGTATTVDSLSVLWPDGEVEDFPPPAVDRDVRLVRGEGSGR